MKTTTILFSKIKKQLIWKQCPICHNRFPEYLIGGNDAAVWQKYHGVGGGIRKTRCPYCGSSDRERLVYLYIRDTYLPKHSGKQVKCLHIAPESQLSMFLRSQSNIDYTAGDKKCEGYDYPDYVQPIDIMDLSSIEDNTYDLIICNHVLEHVENDLVAMQEIRRVLKPSGIAILQVPIALKLKLTHEDPSITTPEERLESYGQWDHVRLYGSDYKERMESAGFEVKVIDIANHYSKKMGLNREEKIFECRKLHSPC